MKGNKKGTIFINVFLFLMLLLIARLIVVRERAQNTNLIIISVDALRADNMSLYGYNKKTTPNVDEWAKKAIVFDNFRTVVPMTFPSFNTLFTGLDPYTTRIFTNYGFILNDDVEALSSILKRYGFHSEAFVTNGGYLQKRFDEFHGYENKFFYFDDDNNERFGMDKENGSKKVIDDAISWLTTNKQKKFFLWVHLIDPHAPYYPDNEYKCKFNKKYCKTVGNKTLDEVDEKRAKYQFCQENTPPKDVVEEMQTLYDGEIAMSDKYVGKLLKSIEKLGLDKKSIIVFYADHGEGFDHNYYFNHREVLYDSAIKIPLILKLPNATSYNKRSNAMIQNTDVLPTILDLMHLDKEAYKFDGKSFSYAINGGIIPNLLSSKRKYSYSVNNTWSKFSIFDGRYKYIYSFPGSCILDNQQEELYDIVNDPKELKNLILEGKNNPTLKRELLSFISRYNLPREIIDQKNDNNGFPLQKSVNEEKGSLQNLNSLGY